MSVIRFGSDGWRARVGEGFDDASVERVADAAAAVLARTPGTRRRIIVGYDTRSGSDRWARIAAEVVAGHGLDAALSSTHVPVSALAWAVVHDGAACGALEVTASRAPADVDGIKVRLPDGGAMTTELAEALESAVPAEPSGLRGQPSQVDVMGGYLASLRSFVDADVVAGAGLRVVADPMYGTARTHFARVLSDLGVAATELHGEPLGDFGGIVPEPTDSWTADCRKAVTEQGASAGLVLDADAARIAAVDERGRFVPPHQLVSLLLGLLVEQRGMRGRVVITTPSSVLVRRQAARLGCPLTVTPVGYRWIRAEMGRKDVLLGAEESGGVGIPAHSYERDGMLAHLLLCELMARTGKTLGRLVDDLEDRVGHMDYGRRDLQMDPASLQMFRNVLPGLNPPSVAGMRPVSVDHADGLRLGFADESWLLLRPSGTEALVRVYAEAATVLERDALLEEGCALARGEME